MSVVQSQREFRSNLYNKPIRLDIYTRDDTIIYDAEMQNLNHKSIDELGLPKRSRFYQSSMDMDFLKKRVNYNDLLESEIIFICTFDPFKRGMWRYSFAELCNEELELELGSGVYKRFFNCSYEGTDIPQDVAELYRYMMDGVVSSDLTRRLDEAVKKVKLNEKWRSDYMKELLHDYDVRTDGEAIGRAEGKKLGIAEGIEIGRAEERERAEAAEARVRELEALLKERG